MTRNPWKVWVRQHPESKPLLWATFVDRYDAFWFVCLLRTQQPTWTVTLEQQFPEVDR